jgi:hypothetical protein
VVRNVATHERLTLVPMIDVGFAAQAKRKPFPQEPLSLSDLTPTVWFKREADLANNDEDRYVVKHEDGWAVKKENAQRASGVFNTQKEAIDRAREIVENSGGGKGDIRIQGRDGQFRDSDSGSKNETRRKDTK